MKSLLAVSTAVTLAAVIVNGQAATPSPAFEVASVKPNLSGPNAPMRVQPQSDRLTINNVPVRQLIQMAYRVATRDDVLGGPSWINDDRFDVAAKAEAAFSADNRWEPMLMTLLRDRFSLAAHVESRATQTLALRRVRADGSLGPQLHPTSEDCEGNLRAGKAPAGVSDPCGLRSLGNAPISGHVKLHGVPLSALFGPIAMDSQTSPISDETGLSGRFDLELVWTPQPYFTANHVEDRRPDADRNAPEMSTALREQLGLKLESSKGSKNVVVIDHVERPTPD